VQALERLLLSCTVCPLDCGNNRVAGELARCYSGRLPVVSSYTAHFGEEPALVGARGAGNIFLGNCNAKNNFFQYNNLHGDILFVTAFDGCGINHYEHPMPRFICGSSSMAIR